MNAFYRIILSGATAILSVTVSIAQNYKAARIDASGKVTDGRGKFMGSVNEAGEIMDTMGVKLAAIDSTGILVDTKSGKELGRVGKNGSFTPYFRSTSDKVTWTTNASNMDIFYVKGLDGTILAKVHENYRMTGAGAIHCLQSNMNRNFIMNKSSPAANYSCPMHPEMTSDKSGKCSKCGMVLKKN